MNILNIKSRIGLLFFAALSSFTSDAKLAGEKKITKTPQYDIKIKKRSLLLGTVVAIIGGGIILLIAPEKLAFKDKNAGKPAEESPDKNGDKTPSPPVKPVIQLDAALARNQMNEDIKMLREKLAKNMLGDSQHVSLQGSFDESMVSAMTREQLKTLSQDAPAGDSKIIDIYKYLSRCSVQTNETTLPMTLAKYLPKKDRSAANVAIIYPGGGIQILLNILTEIVDNKNTYNRLVYTPRIEQENSDYVIKIYNDSQPITTVKILYAHKGDYCNLQTLYSLVKIADQKFTVTLNSVQYEIEFNSSSGLFLSEVKQ